MGSLARVPPGRAGRLWLEHRLHTADRGAGLLDRKLRILRTEQERFRLLAERTGADWRKLCAEADAWLRRGALLGGQREIRLSQAEQPADVTIEWGAVMGVRYPRRALCRPRGGQAARRGPGTAALAEATAAYDRVLVAAADHAAALAACQVIEREVDETRRLLRAIQDRWVPRLQGALRELTERLEEDERSETVRRHWAAARHRADGRGL
ncbi:MAG TPA: V-type ATP synthase subunit D [Pilimelia sp.]|nr:V-type ATP synthase subunit D [Pilimelia sp.]